ncbi:acyltransferase domain-containing protein [Streptomyces sp. NPDC052020]|uniref:acyltransferase domain-containing protein n=1 Tax=Streptomyces sp. NPDC052020 TaxID=3155677 RepID=UPI00342DE3EF
MLPDADELPEILLDLAVPHEDVDVLAGSCRTLTRDAGAMRLLEESVAELLRDLGEVGGPARLGELVTEAPRALGAYFPAYVFVAALPHTRAYHRGRGIPPEVTRRTLADLGRCMAIHRRRHGRGGVQDAPWLVRHFRGELFQLGRLQYERTRLSTRTAAVLAAAGLDAAPGTPCLNLHIPGYRGPLTPAACDRSLTAAREFFARHFPEEPYRTAMCHSWLLDPQLTGYLSPESNIVRFQRRFRLAHGDAEPDDTAPVRFVFGDPDLPVESLPRRTAVERAVGDHLRAGGHWYPGHGWFPL